MIGVLDLQIALYRRTAFICEPVTAAASLVVARQPVRESILLVRLTGGTSNTGGVTITGTVGGTAASETLSFAGAGFRQTVKRFTSVEAVVTTGLADEASPPEVSVEARSPGGELQFMLRQYVANWPAAMSRSRERWAGGISGAESGGESTILVPYAEVFRPQPSDVVRDEASGDEYLVRSVALQNYGGGMHIPSHWELTVTRRDKSTA